MRQHNEHTLPNGLKIIHEPSPTEVVYCGFVVRAGTRNEDEADSGMAHFCEHVTFKGTERRRSWHVLNGLERVGGDLNAYTNKEETVYYAAVLREDFAKAVDLLADIVFHSIYPQREIDKEVEVIIDEIESYKDSPSELIFDEFEEMLFRGHPLGRSILGDPVRLRQLTTADALRFCSKHYQPQNTAFFVYGQVDFPRIVRTVSKATKDLCQGLPLEPIVGLPAYVPEERVVERGTHQAHVLIGNRTFCASDDRRVALFLLNNILGGPGMNSRLNVSLRERSGLVYSVESNAMHYTDTGVWNVYFGCDPDDVERCRKLLLRELRLFREKPLRATQLAAAKKQLKGQIGISCDHFESYALSMGKVFAHYGYYRDIHRLSEQVDAVTSEMIQQIAEVLFAEDQLTTLIYK
ncbi:MAG: pitrilysin family protein [Bacteroidaceae bacterium]